MVNKFLTGHTLSTSETIFVKKNDENNNRRAKSSFNRYERKNSFRRSKSYKTLRNSTKKLDQMVANQTIWGYNIDFKIGCFTFNEALNKKYNTEEGDPVYECRVASYRAYTDRKERPRVE